MVVDLTSGLNLYPDLRLVDNIETDYAASMAAIDDVIEKMSILGANDLIMSLHRFPENNFTREQSWASFDKTLRRIAASAAKDGIALHLRLASAKPPRDLDEAIAFLDRVGAANLRLALNTALLLDQGVGREKLASVRNRIGMWLLSAPAYDAAGAAWNLHAPVAGTQWEQRTAELVSIAPSAPVVFDSVYRNPDEEYRDARALAHSTRNSTPAPGASQSISRPKGSSFPE